MRMNENLLTIDSVNYAKLVEILLTVTLIHCILLFYITPSTLSSR